MVRILTIREQVQVRHNHVLQAKGAFCYITYVHIKHDPSSDGLITASQHHTTRLSARASPTTCSTFPTILQNRCKHAGERASSKGRETGREGQSLPYLRCEREHAFVQLDLVSSFLPGWPDHATATHINTQAILVSSFLPGWPDHATARKLLTRMGPDHATATHINTQAILGNECHGLGAETAPRHKNAC